MYFINYCKDFAYFSAFAVRKEKLGTIVRILLGRKSLSEIQYHANRLKTKEREIDRQRQRMREREERKGEGRD